MNTKSISQPMPGIESCELKGAAADTVIEEATFERFNLDGLSLVPMEQDTFNQKLQRAGFAPVESERSVFRAEKTL